MELAAQLSETEVEQLRERLAQQDAQTLMLHRLARSTDEPALPLSLEPDS
ncbi:MAG: hypothetical protein ACO1SX_12640 [Actinomycetota bacterium]